MSGAMNRLWKVRSLGVNVKRMMHESIVVLTVLYGAEPFGLKVKEKNKLDAMEMRCSRRMRGVTIMDRLRMEK